MITTLKDVELKELAITGIVTMTPVPLEERSSVRWPVLIMGPTGAGKSSFVEALAGPNSSMKNLSSSGLEGYTQSVSPYKVEGIKEGKYRTDIYVLDTPGFADDKISLAEIVSMVQEFLRGNETGARNILYVMPITKPRLSGSQRKVLNAFKTIAGQGASAGVTIVTTMWDTIHSGQAQTRAEGNLEQLKNDIWKDFTENKTEIAKFMNTQESAVAIIDLAYQRTHYRGFQLTDKIYSNYKLSESIFAQDMYTDLVERIEALKMRKANISLDLETLPTSSSEAEDIRTILTSNLEEVDDMLTKFEGQLEEFGIPAAPQETSDASNTLPSNSDPDDMPDAGDSNHPPSDEPIGPLPNSKDQSEDSDPRPTVQAALDIPNLLPPSDVHLADSPGRSAPHLEPSIPNPPIEIQSQDVQRETKKKGLINRLKSSTKRFIKMIVGTPRH